MSERLDFEQGDLPILRMQLGEEDFEATPVNTTLFTYLGRLAMYDHVFFAREEEDETTSGAYLFNQHPKYEEIVEFLMSNDYPAVLNRLEVPDCDVNAFDNMVAQTIGGSEDFVPDDWMRDE